MKTETTTHTEGEWLDTNSETNTGDRNISVKDNGFNRIIAKVFSTDQDDVKANARLIATAPELLKACKLVSDNWSYAEKGSQLDRILNAVRDAIAKANGRKAEGRE